MKKFTNACVKLVDKYLPDPFLFAIVLTLICYVMAVVFTGNGPIEVLSAWGNFSNGIWNLLKFSMQTSMIVVFGSALAKTPAFTNLINKVAEGATTNNRAIILVTLFSGVICWLNYGLGLIAGALLARAIARKLRTVDYRVLIASAYSGFCIWHQGLSGSIPLDISKGREFAGIKYQADITSTIFHPVNLITVVVCLIVLALVNTMMQPDPDKTFVVDAKVLEEKPPIKYEIKTPADKLEHSKVLWALTCALGFGYGIYYFSGAAGIGASILNRLERDSVNLVLLFLGIFLHGDLRKYIDAVKDSVSSVAGVILQYPFYAGIMAIMVCTDANGKSLAVMISNFFVSISNKYTFPMFAYWAAGVVNFLVPSGGGQWTVQGPIMMSAARALGVKDSVASMAIAYGDEWTNMLQPFWALPALAVANLRAKDIMGYMVVVTIASGIVLTGSILLWAVVAA